MTPVYRVSFFKKVTGSSGHTVDACQGVVEVHAPTQLEAVEVARMRFAELAQVNAWSLRADYEKVECLPERKHTSSLPWQRSRRSR